MSDTLLRRRFLAGLAVAVSTLGGAGCTEASEEGTPPSTEAPQEGPVADQNGDTEQQPGRGPAGDSAEGNTTELPEERGDAAAAPDEPGQGGEEDDGNESTAGGGGAGDDGGDGGQ